MTVKYDYIMCPCCGIGHGRNVLKDPEPIWVHCDECRRTHKIEYAWPEGKVAHPNVQWAWMGLGI